MANDVQRPSPLITVEPAAICSCRDGTTPCQWNRLPFDVWSVVMMTASWADTTMCPPRPVRRWAVINASAASAAASAVCFHARSPAACHGGSSVTPFSTVNPPAAPAVRSVTGSRGASRRKTTSTTPRRSPPSAGSRSRKRAVAGLGSIGPMTTSTPASMASIGAHPSSVVVSIAMLRFPALCTAFHTGPRARRTSPRWSSTRTTSAPSSARYSPASAVASSPRSSTTTSFRKVRSPMPATLGTPAAQPTSRST